jgi:hypothetical protein
LAAVSTMLVGSPALDADEPGRILSGASVRHGRVFLAGVRTMWRARGIVAGTGHRSTELWWRGAPVRYELDERAEVRVEFGNGLVLMAAARRQHDAMRLTPLRRELGPLDLVLVPSRRQP